MGERWVDVAEWREGGSMLDRNIAPTGGRPVWDVRGGTFCTLGMSAEDGP